MPLLGVRKPIEWCSLIRRMVYFDYVWVMGITLVSAHGNLFTFKRKFFYVEYLMVQGPGFTSEF